MNTTSNSEHERLVVGAMSGTSLDGVDAIVFALHHPDGGTGEFMPRVLAHEYRPYQSELRSALEKLCSGADIRLEELGRLDLRVARAYVSAIAAAIQKAGRRNTDVTVVGAHGQTVHHQPVGDERFTMQIGDPNTMAIALGIPVVADFRRRDMALGGQGAPLAPGFHHLALRVPDQVRVVLNSGGIANVTALVPGMDTFGFDVGPANVLMDAWIQHCRGERYDKGGIWARSGVVIAPLLQEMLREPYFAAKHPKSTGRELFNLPWVQRAIGRSASAQAVAADVQRTLLELSVTSVADAVRQCSSSGSGQLLVCGGGAQNEFFMGRLAQAVVGWEVSSTDRYGIPAQAMEAMAFATFALRTFNGLPSSEPHVTGASRRCLLGAVYAP